MRILAFTPTFDDAMRPETEASMDAQQFDGTLDWIISKDNPYPVPDHRNVLAQFRVGRERCLTGGYDALLTFEHDMILPDHAVQVLSETPGDVIYGVYVLRHGAYVLNAYEYINDHALGESLSLHPEKAEAARDAGAVRVSGIGWGCTLIHRHVLEMFPFPEVDPDNPAHDVTFAKQCVAANLMQIAQFNVLCGHVSRDLTLWPFEADAAVYRTVRPLYTMNVWDGGNSVRIVAGQECKLLAETAINLARANYVVCL
jgi:hypothetical protein